MKLIKPTRMVDIPLYPPLEKLLTELYLKVPTLSFQGCTTDNWLRDLPKDTPQISGVRVFNGVEEVGRVEVSYRQHRGSGERLHVYEINSGRIKKKIGNRQTKETSKYSEAFKLAAKVFAMTKTSHERGEEMWKKFAREIGSVHYNAKRAAERVGEPYSIEMVSYLLKYVKDKNTPIPSQVLNMLDKPDTEKVINTCNIVAEVDVMFDNACGCLVVEERDGTMTEVRFHANTDFLLRKLESSYDLPELLQPKLGMLKMLKEKQAAESIGIKIEIDERNWYFLCDGEIITTS